MASYLTLFLNALSTGLIIISPSTTKFTTMTSPGRPQGKEEYLRRKTEGSMAGVLEQGARQPQMSQKGAEVCLSRRFLGLEQVTGGQGWTYCHVFQSLVCVMPGTMSQ